MSANDFLDRIVPRSVLAGLMIAVADYVYVNASDRVVASFLFPLALVCIIKSGAYLYTGKIGSVGISLIGAADMAVILLGNLIGLTVLFLVPYSEAFGILVAAKMSCDLWDIFMKGFFCGVLMYLAVFYTDGGKNPLVTIMCVAAFLIGGCEHSVADLGYLFLSRTFSWEAVRFFFCVLAGNTVGSLTVRFLASVSGGV